MLRRSALIGSMLCCAITASLVAQELQRFGGESQRVSTRIAYFGKNSSAGQFAIEYGQPEWKAEYETEFDTLTRGKRWRFGNNFWTTLDTHLDLTIAGTAVPTGYYYLALERSEGDDWSLVLLDPKTIQSKKLDAFQAELTTGGLSVPLTWEKTENVTEKLTIKLAPADRELDKATLTIWWGKHKLTADIVVNL
jgi:hypothetical protein